MTCNPEISDIIIEMIEEGLLAIRVCGWGGQADRCAHEADHLHNLPRLLEDYSPERLLYYWDVERPTYIERAAMQPLAAYEPLWKRLQSHIATIRRPTQLP